MAINDRDREVIDRFLLQGLTAEDQVYFDERSADIVFSNYLEEQKAIVEIIKLKGQASLKEKLVQLETSFQDKKIRPTLVLNNTYKYLIAASFAILASALIWLNQSQPSSDELFAQYYTPYPNLIDPLTKGSSGVELSPYQLYEQQQYEKAIEKLQSDLSQDAVWYKAQSNLALGKFELAQKLFSEIQDTPSSEYNNEAEWYQALIQLKLKEKEKAVEIIKKIVSNPKHNYNKKAVDFLKSLN